MKQLAKSSLQLNLSLLNVPAAAIPDDKKMELTVALVELLMSAAVDGVKAPANGGEDESEAHG
jgi:hypothetical protein